MSAIRKVMLGSVVGALVAPAGAAALMESVPKAESPAKPSCPNNPCLAISRTIGYQAKVGTDRGLMTVPRKGRIVSWTITLSKPGTKQIEFFDSKLGGPSEASIAVLRFGKKLRARVVSVAPSVKLKPYFGRTVEFALTKSIPVEKGNVIALSVPTWAPALSVNHGSDTSWRASRKRGSCDDTQTQTAFGMNEIPQFYCLYRTAQITYSARVISTP
ncbi:MAG TPA: hypothetical protein PKB03_06345 [Baekduia sp.]|nr:hypothetical protein [Baekduia sp.]